MKEFTNIDDYIVWRGDLSKTKDDYNEVDYALLSVISYSRFENLEEKDKGKTLRKISPKVLSKKREELSYEDKKVFDTFCLLRDSARFGTIKFQEFFSTFDPKSEEQFAAILFSSGKDAYLIFRGTDNTITGWKEDFNLGFSPDIPSEHSALSALESIAPFYNSITLAGHSKGGLLALWIALKCKKETFNKIKAVYSFDGPGVPFEFKTTKRWKETEEKAMEIVPESSLIGRLFLTPKNLVVTESNSVGILQHDIHSWKVISNKFTSIKKTNITSDVSSGTINDFIMSCSPEERKTLVETAYSILRICDTDDVNELPAAIIKNFPKILDKIHAIPYEERKVLWQLSGIFKVVSKKNLRTKLLEKETNG